MKKLTQKINLVRDLQREDLQVEVKATKVVFRSIVLRIK